MSDHAPPASVGALPAAPEVTPKLDEWARPLDYVVGLLERFEDYGIVKIVPPVAATPRLDVNTLADHATVFGGDAAPAAPLATLRVGVRTQTVAPRAWADVRAATSPRPGADTVTTAADFLRAGRARVVERYGGGAPPPAAQVEADFWREWARGGNDGSSPPLTAACGDGVTGSLFKPPSSGCPLAASPWNLAALARASASQVADSTGADAVAGVSTLQMGELFAHSEWQVEPAHLFSIHYAHAGDPKVWYAAGARDADALEAATARGPYAAGLPSRRRARSLLPASAPLTDADNAATAAALATGTTMEPPAALAGAGVRVCRAEQTAGTFVVIFPRAYRASVCAGLYVGEAATLAPAVVLPHALDAADRHRALHTVCPVDVGALVLAHARRLAAGRPESPACDKAVAIVWNVAATRVEWQVGRLTGAHGAALRSPLVADFGGACAQCGSPPRLVWVRLARNVAAVPPAHGCWSKKRWRRGDVVCAGCALAVADAAASKLADRAPDALPLAGAEIARTPAHDDLLRTLGCGRAAQPALAAALAAPAWLPTAGLTRLLGGDARALRTTCDESAVGEAAAAAVAATAGLEAWLDALDAGPRGVSAAPADACPVAPAPCASTLFDDDMLLDDDDRPLLLDDIDVDELLGGASPPATSATAALPPLPVPLPQASPFAPLALCCPSPQLPSAPLAACTVLPPSSSASPSRPASLSSVPSTSNLSGSGHLLLPDTSQPPTPLMARGASVSPGLPTALSLTSLGSTDSQSPRSARPSRHAAPKRYRQTPGRSFEQKCAILESFYGRRQPLKWGQWRETADRVADPAIGRKEVKDFLASLAQSYAEQRAGKDRHDVVLLLRSVTEQASNHFKRQWRLSKHAQPHACTPAATSDEAALPAP